MNTTLSFDTPNALTAFAKLVAQEVVAATHPKQDLISKRKASAEFGAPWIEARTAEGKLKATRSGEARNSHVLYSRAECLALKEWERQQLISM